MAKRGKKPQVTVYLDEREKAAIDHFVAVNVLDKSQVFRVGLYAYAKAGVDTRRRMAAEYAAWEEAGFPALEK